MKYLIKGAIANAMPWNNRYNPIDEELLGCYQDTFVLGEFKTDEDAIKAAETLQYKHDKKASRLLAKIQKERGWYPTNESGRIEYGLLGCGGPDYVSSIWCEDGTGNATQVGEF